MAYAKNYLNWPAMHKKGDTLYEQHKHLVAKFLKMADTNIELVARTAVTVEDFEHLEDLKSTFLEVYPLIVHAPELFQGCRLGRDCLRTPGAQIFRMEYLRELNRIMRKAWPDGNVHLL